MSERRRDTRAISFFRTEIDYRRKFYVGYIVNLSVTGCAFAHENLMSIEEGGQVRVKFRMNGKIITATTEVRWRDTALMGLKFEKISAAAVKAIRDYIKTVTVRRVPL